MLDSAIKEQLAAAFAALEHQITLQYDESAHDNQAELLGMLGDVAGTSGKIQLGSSGESSPYPQFRLLRDGKPTGITFKGIPGGHEFTSFVLAILHTDGKGKPFSKPVADRVRRLRGPIRLRTYVSLSCENCPDVVQALNHMALVHPDFRHEMIDGGYVPDEVEALGIQGVPSVVRGTELVHSGKAELLDLLAKLEAAFGSETQASAPVDTDLGHFDVVVIGGGPAGASAAIYSARKGLKTVLLAEQIGGQVRDTKGIENLISVRYTEGQQLSAQLLEHLGAYPITILEQRRVASIVSKDDDREIKLEGGERLRAASLIIATGAKWRELGIPGEKEYLGRGVAFCPHCDGPFYKGRKVAVVGGGNSGVEAAIDLANLASEVVLLEYNDKLKADKVLVDKALSLPNVSFITSARTSEVIGDGQKVTGLAFHDRTSGETKQLALDGVFVQIGLMPNSGFAKDLVELTAAGEIVVDAKGRTSAVGVYAAGDVTTTPYKQIVIAMGDGAKAALAAFEDRMYAVA